MIKTARRIGNLRPNPNFNLLPPFLLRQFIEKIKLIKSAMRTSSSIGMKTLTTCDMTNNLERCFETGDSE